MGCADSPLTAGDGHTTIDAVLPIKRSDHDRFVRLLLPSMRHFFAGLGTCWMLAPSNEVEDLRALVDDPRFVVLAEEEIVPEITAAKKRRAARGERVSGWMIQQLLKLSIARSISSSFYLTLDADVLCVKPTTVDSLVVAGRGIANVRDELPQANPKAPHARWYRHAAEMLGLPESRRTHGVTPAVLSRDGAIALLSHLEARPAADGQRAEAYLLENLDWTEYTLYYTFLEGRGLFARYHVPAAENTYGNNIWKRWDPEAWDPAASFAGPDGMLFSVLQSNNPRLDIDRVVERVRRYFHARGEISPF